MAFFIQYLINVNFLRKNFAKKMHIFLIDMRQNIKDRSKMVITEHEELTKFFYQQPFDLKLHRLTLQIIQNSSRWVICLFRNFLDKLFIKDFQKDYGDSLRKQIVPGLSQFIMNNMKIQKISELKQVLSTADQSSKEIKGNGGIQVIYYLYNYINGVEPEFVQISEHVLEELPLMLQWLMLRLKYRDFNPKIKLLAHVEIQTQAKKITDVQQQTNQVIIFSNKDEMDEYSVERENDISELIVQNHKFDQQIKSLEEVIRLAAIKLDHCEYLIDKFHQREESLKNVLYSKFTNQKCLQCNALIEFIQRMKDFDKRNILAQEKKLERDQILSLDSIMLKRVLNSSQSGREVEQ